MIQTLSFSFVSRRYWSSACPKLDLSNLHRRSVDLTQHPLSFRNTAEQSAHRKSIKTCWMRVFHWPVSLFVSAEQPLPLIRFQRCSGREDSNGLGTNSEAGKSSSLHRPLQFWYTFYVHTNSREPAIDWLEYGLLECWVTNFQTSFQTPLEWMNPKSHHKTGRAAPGSRWGEPDKFICASDVAFMNHSRLWGNYDAPYYAMMIWFLIEILQNNNIWFAICMFALFFVCGALAKTFASWRKRQVPQLYANGIMRPIMEFLAGGPLL